MPNFFIFIFVAIQKTTGCHRGFFFELQQQQKSKQESFVFRIWFSAVGRCNEINIRTKKNEDMSMFFLISLNSTPHVRSCQQVLTSSRIQVYTTRFYAASMKFSMTTLLTHTFPNFTGPSFMLKTKKYPDKKKQLLRSVE